MDNTNNLNIKYKSWDEITIKVFNKINNIDKNIEPQEAVIELLAILTDTDTNTILNTNINKINKLTEEILFIQTPPQINTNKKHTTITVGNKKLKIVEPKNFTVSQYIDFQAYSNPVNLTNIITTAYIPTDKDTYNKDYNIEELAEEIENKLPITTAQEIGFFLIRRFQTSILNTLRYSIWMMKILKRLTMSKLQKEAMNLRIKEMEGLMLTHGTFLSRPFQI